MSILSQSPTANNSCTLARSYRNAGISIIPIRADGSKKTTLPTWKEYQLRLPTEAELQSWFTHTQVGIATIAGRVSGNLEIMDFDNDADRIFPLWQERVQRIAPGLLDKLHVTKTPRPGYHVRYRCTEIDIPGNMDLAFTADKEKKLIETRGEGGYALAPGCPPECHDAHRTYEDLDGEIFGYVNEPITAAERQILIDAAKSFDESKPKALNSHDFILKAGAQSSAYVQAAINRDPLFLDDDPDTTISNLRSKARRQQIEHGLDLLIIDYLQLIEVTDRAAGENRTQQVSHISRSLKNLARELGTPVIALSQLSRSTEQRNPPIPILSDLRDSGGIEQDSDIVLMLYRQEMYNEDCDNPGETDVYVRKNRNGPTGRVSLFFDKAKMSFRDMRR